MQFEMVLKNKPWEATDVDRQSKQNAGAVGRNESGIQRQSLMELALNLEWTAVAVAMCWLWARHARREGPGRRVQGIALALVLATMFVVITMYDDMAMAQNPAEIRCFQREDDLGAHVLTPLILPCWAVSLRRRLKFLPKTPFRTGLLPSPDQFPTPAESVG